MYRRIKIGFLLLVLTQGLHSVEEYYGKLWTVLSPARFVSSLFSTNLGTGFLIVNTGLFLFGILCWYIVTRNNKISNQLLIWISIEVFNGIGHPLLALNARSYFPGLFTAPILFILSIYLARQFLIYNGLPYRRVNHDNGT